MGAVSWQAGEQAPCFQATSVTRDVALHSFPLLPTSQSDTTKTVTQLIPNCSSIPPSQGLDPAGYSLEHTAPKLKRQWQLSAGWDLDSLLPGCQR